MARTARPKRSRQTTQAPAGLEPREKLLFHARALFLEKSFDGVNIRDVMAEAEVTQSGIYYYFQNKDGLFLTVLLDILKEIDLEFNLALRPAPFDRQLQALAQAFIRTPPVDLGRLFHELNARIILNAQAPAQGLTLQEARPAFLYVNQIWPRGLENLLREAQRAGEIQAPNPAFLSHYLLTLLSSYSHSPFSGLRDFTAELSTNALLEFLGFALKIRPNNAQI